MILRLVSTLGIVLTLLSSSCSVNRLALQATGGMFKDASAEMETDSDWDMFAKALPANLKTLAGLYSLDTSNKDLSQSLVKGYAAYAYGISETLYLNEKFKDETDGPLKAETIRNYSKALYYGFNYLAQFDVTAEQMMKADSAKGLEAYLERRIGTDRDALETLLYIVQAWANVINMQKTNVPLLAQFPLVKHAGDFGCRHLPDFQQGFCDIFAGSYEASLGKAMGGDPVKGEAFFVKAIEKYPNSIMARVSYVERFLIPFAKKEEYLKQKPVIQRLIKQQEQLAIYIPGESDKLDRLALKDALMEAISAKRFQIIEKNENSLF